MCVNKIPIEEFDDNEEESPERDEGDTTKNVSKFVKSVTDMEFGMKWLVRDPFNFDCPMLCFEVHVDGKLAVKKVLPKERYNGELEGFISGIRDVDQENNQGTLRSFRFARVETSKSWTLATFLGGV